MMNKFIYNHCWWFVKIVRKVFSRDLVCELMEDWKAVYYWEKYL